MTVVLDLKKSFQLNLEKAGLFNPPVLETRLAVDTSGSMDNLFRNGFVSRAIDKFTIAALKFDDNQSLEVGRFSSNFEFTEEATEKSVGRYLKDNPNFFNGGGTNYTPIIRQMESKLDTDTQIRGSEAPAPKAKGFFSRLLSSVTVKDTTPSDYAFKRTAPHRAYCGVITDGDNGDMFGFEAAMRATSSDTFYQFIGLGSGVSGYLSTIAKKYDHVDFVQVVNPMAITDDEFFALICNKKFATWCEKFAPQQTGNTI